MKVLIVNTSERTGGAAVAAGRLCDALNNNGVKARMLVRDKQSDNICVLTPRWPRLQKWHFLWERLRVLMHLHGGREHLFHIDIANSGIDITRLQAFREADVVHLHWVQQGMLSLRGIEKILRSGKPVVWTMHDLWPASAICHLSFSCHKYAAGCSNCPYLPGGGSANDLSARAWRRKQRMLQAGTVNFVACSRWLESEAKKSALLRNQHVTSIPNTIDTHVYCPGDKAAARRAAHLPEQGRLLLFVCQRVTNSNKGMDYLVEACRILAQEHPEMTADTTLLLMGSHADELTAAMPFRTVALGYIDDEQQIVDIYRSADVFVLPSLSENLPNTIMEAMACGLPCVGFRVGGIPEEIDHRKNGYVAELRNSADLAKGMLWVLSEADHDQLSKEAVRKVARQYSQSTVAVQYTELYQHAIVERNLKI